MAEELAAKSARTELNDLKGFNLVEVLRLDSARKLVFVHAKDADGDSAVIIMEKTAFTEESILDPFFKRSSVSLLFQNDIYGSYDLSLPILDKGYKATVIWPATEKHVEKYRDQDLFLVSETAADYESITLPHILESSLTFDWIYNVLEHKAETDRIIAEDPDPELGFVLACDLKWNGKDLENLYVTAIVRKRDIKSLRDLTGEHVPLLTNVLEKSLAALKERYGIPADCFRSYLHYQPSYYHLHIHFSPLKSEVPGFGADRAHLARDVINNLRIFPDYYKRATLTYTLRANDPLLLKLKPKESPAK